MPFGKVVVDHVAVAGNDGGAGLDSARGIAALQTGQLKGWQVVTERRWRLALFDEIAGEDDIRVVD